MGLDVYVGPLSRYYTGQWETIVQQYGRQAGMQVRVVRQPVREPLLGRVMRWIRPAPDVDREVARWQRYLSMELGVPVQWDDDARRDYFTDKPAWDCYGALLLWAAYQEAGATKLPETSDNWTADVIYQASANHPESKYSHLVSGAEIWIPTDFPHPVEVQAMTGEPVILGSVPRVVAQLRALNEASWRADAEAISAWRRDGADVGAPLALSAQMGFAVFSRLADLAAEHRLPMKLDY